MARLRLLSYRWPRRVSIFTIAASVIGALGLAVVAVLMTNQGPICGSVQMQPGDECYFGGSDSPASYSDMANSPLPSVVFAGAVAIVGWLVLHVRRQNKPTRNDIYYFERYVEKRRRELKKIYESTPECQETWATPDELLGLFDKRVARERKRKGFAAPGAT